MFFPCIINYCQGNSFFHGKYYFTAFILIGFFQIDYQIDLFAAICKGNAYIFELAMVFENILDYGIGFFGQSLNSLFVATICVFEEKGMQFFF